MRRLIAIAATTTTLGTLGVTATAQAQQAGPARQASRGADPTVPSGVETAVSLASCPAGSSPAVAPGPPAAVNVVIQRSSTAVAVKLAGDWLTTGSTTFTVKCSATVTKKSTVTVTAAPPENAAVGVGADTLQNLTNQFSADYNAILASSANSHLYSWDSTNPTTGAIGDKIAVKTNCASIRRPDGSSQGIEQLVTGQSTSDRKFDCVNFAPSSRNREFADPPLGKGGIGFVVLAGDAVTWATPATTDAPKSLTTAQLAEIYSCSVPGVNGFQPDNWADLGGKNAPIRPFLPTTAIGADQGIETLSFFLAAIGVDTPGPCVSTDNNTLQDNDGVNPVLNSPAAIYPYSVGDYIAQRFHSAKCLNSSCMPGSRGVICTPSGTQNTFGCDTHGPMVLKEINGVAPTTGTGGKTSINRNFPPTMIDSLADVVPFDPNTADHIPGSESGAPGGVNLEKIFGASGWACTSKTAKTDIKNYGFVPLESCGIPT